MRRGSHITVSSLVNGSPGMFLALLFCFTAGLSAGVFIHLFLAAPEKTELSEYLYTHLLTQGSFAPSAAAFLSSASGNLFFLLILFLAGASVIGFPAVFPALAARGLALGFSCALLLQSMQGQGAAVILLAVLPQNLFLLPAFLFAAVAALNGASYVFANRSRGIKKSLAQMAGPYGSLFVILAGITLLGCLVESFIAPALLQLIK